MSTNPFEIINHILKTKNLDKIETLSNETGALPNYVLCRTLARNRSISETNDYSLYNILSFIPAIQLNASIKNKTLSDVLDSDNVFCNAWNVK